MVTAPLRAHAVLTHLVRGVPRGLHQPGRGPQPPQISTQSTRPLSLAAGHQGRVCVQSRLYLPSSLPVIFLFVCVFLSQSFPPPQSGWRGPLEPAHGCHIVLASRVTGPCAPPARRSGRVPCVFAAELAMTSGQPAGWQPVNAAFAAFFLRALSAWQCLHVAGLAAPCCARLRGHSFIPSPG